MEATLRKQLRKQNKWKRGLSRNLVEGISALQPTSVTFDIQHPELVRCIITTRKGRGIGLAICSVLDVFEDRRGKHLAAGRALKALVKESDSELIRCDHDFPQSWTFRQANRVSNLAYEFWKSQFVPIV